MGILLVGHSNCERVSVSDGGWHCHCNRTFVGRKPLVLQVKELSIKLHMSQQEAHDVGNTDEAARTMAYKRVKKYKPLQSTEQRKAVVARGQCLGAPSG